MTQWLDEDERRAWLRLAGVMLKLSPALDSQLQRDSDLTHFDYLCLAMLSETGDRTLRMSELAARTNASLSRLSHVVSKLERRGWVARAPSPDSRRVTLVRLSEDGWDVLVKVGLPRSMPYFYGSLKVAITLAFVGTTVSEMTAANEGIGYLLISAGSAMQMGLAFAGLVVVGAMAMVMYELFSVLEQHTTGWAHRGSQAA